MSEWISVEDGLPEEGDKVLCYSTERGMWLDEFNEQRECPVPWSSASIPTGCWFNDDYENDVTHWMPLPAPPVSSPDNDCPTYDLEGTPE